MHRIEQAVRSVTEDRRASYLFDTSIASEAVGCHPNKFNDWWQRTRRKLIELHLADPGALAAEFMSLIATAEVERTRQSSSPGS